MSIQPTIIEATKVILRPERSTLRWDSAKKSKLISINRQNATAPKSNDKLYIVGNESFDTQNEYKWVLLFNISGDILIGVADTKDNSEKGIVSHQLSVITTDTVDIKVENNSMTIIHKSKRINTYTINLKRAIVCPWVGNVNEYAFDVEIKRNAFAELTAQPDGTFCITNQIEMPNSSKLQQHLANTDKHFLQHEIDHKKIQNHGRFLHDDIDAHIDDPNIHFNVDMIDHDRIQNNGRFSHVDIDKHILNTSTHFTVQSILHDNIANVGQFSHPQIDTHIRKHDVHFKMNDIDHAKLLGIGKYAHTDIDFHIDNFLVHHELNDLAVDKKNVWSAAKIKNELDKIAISKLGVDGGKISGDLELTGNITVSTLHTDSIVFKGVKHDFEKPLYTCWLYNSLEGCYMFIPVGGKYDIISATNTIAYSGGSACIYKIMSTSGLPEIDLSNAVNTGEMLFTTNKRMIEIDFHICSEVEQHNTWTYRLTVGTFHYYYAQKHNPNCTNESSGKIITTINGLTSIYLSVGNGNNEKTKLIINSVMLSVKTLNV